MGTNAHSPTSTAAARSRNHRRLAGAGAVVALLWAGTGSHHARAEAAPEKPVELQPMAIRPWVLIEPLKGMGMLLPSGQEVAKLVVMAMVKRYGQGFVALEEEYENTMKLRRMAGPGFKLPGDSQRLQDMRMATLKWAKESAPYRIKVFFKFDKKTKEYVSSAECRERTSKTPVHRIEGRGKGYDSALAALEPHLGTFCAVLDNLALMRSKGQPAP